MRSAVLILASIAAAIAAALFTGLIEVTPAGLVGAIWYGYPFSWLERLVIAQYNPWRENLENLALDVGFWFVVALLVAVAATALRTPKSAA